MEKSYEGVRSNPSLKICFVFREQRETGSEACGNTLWISIKKRVLPKNF